ncbi:MAG: AAA family ATPase, partial [Sedimentisphaerales bacterium]|nr:AAA family ATPase [Sedimentisphaerales bacterium]
MLGMFPAVAVLGPRQCGKTTLARQLGGVYFDMETQGSQARLDSEWDSLTGCDKLIVIDEAQQAPWVFSRLRGTIDSQRKKNGRFLLTGSVSPALMKN